MMNPLSIKKKVRLKRIKNLIPFLLTILFFGCSSGDDSNPEPSPQPNPILTSLVVSSSNGNRLDLNGTNTTTLAATGRDQSGQPISFSTSVEWTANNNNVSVNQNGVVTGMATGNSAVTASVGSITKTFNITIVDSTPQTGTFIYVSDTANFATGPWKILKYDENGQNPELFIDDRLGQPQDIIFLENDNEVLISNFIGGNINRYNATTGNFISSFATGLNKPTRMKIGADNLLYVIQWGGSALVVRYQLDGTLVDQFTNVGVPQSIGMDWDSNGNFYVSSYNDAIVRKFDSDGNNTGVFINSNLSGPTNIWFDNTDNLFVLDWNAGRVVKFNASGDYIENFILGLNQPEGIDFLPNGNILIGNGGTSEIKLYDSNGNFLQNLVSAGSGGLIQPNAVRIREID